MGICCEGGGEGDGDKEGEDGKETHCVTVGLRGYAEVIEIPKRLKCDAGLSNSSVEKTYSRFTDNIREPWTLLI